jgi:hypothetical protein
MVGEMSNIETPNYTVIKKYEDIELREYPQMMLVSTGEQGEYEDMSNKAFMRLFNYISGENDKSEKISMTSPVFMHNNKASDSLNEDNNDWVMSFIVPKDYSQDSVPSPQHTNVSLQELESKVFAVIRFSGTLDQELILKNKKLLTEYLLSAQLQYKDNEYYVAAYNPPWTLPNFRRNEVLIEVFPEQGK